MLDIHTHILPKMDDGSKSVKESIRMLRREAKQGIDKVMLTPHFYADKESPERFLARRDAALEVLDFETSLREGLPECYVGAEVSYFSGVGRVDGLEQFCLGDSRALLLEMPFEKWNKMVLDEVLYLKECRGIRPVIAHAERYVRYQSRGTLRQLCERGIWIQTNTSFFLQWQSSWLAMWMLKDRMIHFVGSDCHDLKKRPPNLGKAIEVIDKRLGKSAMKHLANMERRLLEG